MKTFNRYVLLGWRERLLILSLILLAVLPVSGFAVEIQVPSQYPTIQAAIDTSQNGDVIIVQPGTYAENINFNGKAITLSSTNPLDPTIVANTIIDGSMNGSVVTFDSSETPNSVLTGFTIRNGSGTLIDGKRYGGGIFCGLRSTPTIRHNKIVNNTADFGGGIYIHGDSPPIITNGPNADYPYANKSQTVGLSVTATDPDGDVLVYKWTPREGGTITGTGSTVSFSAATAGVYHIDLTVDDQHGGKATGVATVTVIGIAIQTIPQLKVGQSSSISALATPLVANSPQYPVSFTWSVTQGPAAGTFDSGVNGTPGATSISFTPSASGPGKIQVVYQVGMVSTSHSLAIALNPIVLSIDPASGIQNTTVQPVLTGNNLGRVSSVSLSGSGVTVTIRDGKTENSLPVQFVIDKEAAAGNRTISLITPEGTFSTSLTFQVVALPPITANPTSLNIVVGNTGPMVFSIPSPAPSGGVTLTLSSSAATVATVPASATIPQGQTSIQVIVTSVGVGTATVTANAAAYSKVQVPVTVANSPLTGYFYRKTLTIDHTKVPSTVNNFPVLVSISNDIDLKNHVTSVNGYDLIFIDAGGNKLDHELERWDGSTGTVVAWVKVPVLSSTADTLIYMWYGNSWVTTSQENKTGVWDANYKGVWHLEEATGANASDSTSNGNTGTPQNSPAQTTGNIDGGLNLNGTNQYVTTPITTVYQQFTLSAWIKPSSAGNSASTIVSKNSYYATSWTDWPVAFYGSTAGTSVSILVTPGIDYHTALQVASPTFTADEWHHVVATYDGSTLRAYADGAYNQVNGSYTLPSNSRFWTIGRAAAEAGGGIGTSSYKGSIDEVRISNVARSPDWILTEYRNQSSPSTFFNAGSEIINHAPVAQNQSVSTNQDTAKAITLVATDPDGDPLTYQIVTQPGHGTLSGTPPNVMYTPAAGYTGSDSFTFKANDGMVDSNIATISIKVNHAPAAQDQSVTAYQGTARAVTLIATDADGDPLTYQIVVQPAHGTLSGTPPNVTYTPAAGYSGSDSFTFKANDGMADSNVATISITVAQYSGPGFLYRKAITIDHTKVSATLSSFPVLVSIANDNDLKNHVSSPSGYDIVFVDSSGTLLDHEMEKWDGATGTLVAWVRIPSLSSTSDTMISMLYGNTGVTTSQENRTGVWDSNFVGVWHLKDPTNPTDSTSNGNNGTNYGATAGAGKIDGAGSFDGTSNYMSFNQSALERVFDPGSPWTISLWVMLGKNSSSWEWIWCKAYTSHTDPYYQIDLKLYASNTIGAYIWSTSYGTGLYLSQATTLTMGVWSKIDMVGQGGGTSPFLSLYVNGNLIGTNTSPKGSYANYSTPIALGMDANIVGSYYAFGGSIDESRISNVARSANWILTEYRNQSSPSTFYGIGSEGPGGPVNHAPVAQNQSVITNQDTAKAITLVATDADGDPLTYQIVAQPAHGALSGAPPNVTCTPAAGYVGSDGFTFKANDGMADSNVATISIVAQVSVPGFLYRKAITIDHTKVSATLLDFPVLVSIANDNDLKNHVSSPSGYDIVFIDSSGVLLDHEMEKWDGATGTLVAWVRIPSLSSTSDTVISMLYGNTGVTTSQENKTGVWDSNFKGVWHLPNGTTLNTAASNSGGNFFGVHGVTATGGQVDGAASFVRSSSTYLSQASDSNNNISGDITVSLWFYPTYTLGSGEYYTLIHKDSQYSITIFSNGISWADGTNWSYANFGYYNIGIQNNVWQHLVVTKTGTTVTIYLNGVQQVQKSFGGSGVSSGIYALFLGTYNSQAGSSGFYGGYEDEVRLSNITRSPDWILTEYRNQSSPLSFFTVGLEEQIGP